MASLSSILDQAAADIMSTLETPATFTPVTGAAVDLYVHVETETLISPGSYDANIHIPGTKINYALADLGREPNRGETFTVGTTVYTFQAVVANNGHICKVVVR